MIYYNEQVAVAEANPSSSYGQRNIVDECPCEAYRFDGFWYAGGMLPAGYLGGIFVIVLNSQQRLSTAPDPRQTSWLLLCHTVQNICLPLPVCQIELPLLPQCPPPLSRFAPLQRPSRPGTLLWVTATITSIGRGSGGVPVADAAPVARASTAASALRRCAGSFVSFSFCGMRVGCPSSVMAGAPRRWLAAAGPCSGRRLSSPLCSV